MTDIENSEFENGLNEEPVDKLTRELDIEPKDDLRVNNDDTSGEVGQGAGTDSRKDKSEKVNPALKYLTLVKDKIKLKPQHKEKIKSFATSNVGIVIIVVVIASAAIALGVYHKHSKALQDNNAWGGTSVATVQENTEGRSARASASVKKPEVKTTFRRESSANDTKLNEVLDELKELKGSMQDLNQRLMVVSQQLTKKVRHERVNHHYRVLGWRLDQDTNQWIADIEYRGRVKAYYPGQRFGRWVVRSVDANGVEIK